MPFPMNDEDRHLLEEVQRPSSIPASAAARRGPRVLLALLLALAGVAAVVGGRQAHGAKAAAAAAAASAAAADLSAASEAAKMAAAPPPADEGDGAIDACVATTSPANEGYDVVAYFSLKPGADAVLGSTDYAFVFQGYTYYFSTAANLKLFSASPASYVPQWGGFCSYGVSSETWWTWATVQATGPKADPNVWMVRSGKLYLFMYEVPKRKFLTGNVDAKIKSGMETWTSWVGDGFTDAYANTGCYWADALCGQYGDECVAAKDTVN